MILFAFGTIGFNVPAYLLISDALVDKYPQLPSLIMGILFALLGITCAIGSIALKIYRIKDDRLELISIFGFLKNAIPLDDIKSWSEVEKENKYTKWKDLTLHLDKTNIKISSTFVSNYNRFKRALVNGKPRNERTEKAWFRKNALQFGIGFMIVSLPFYYWSYSVYHSQNTPLLYEETQEITSTLIGEIEIQESRNDRSIRFAISAYPEFIFQIGGNAYSATYVNSLLDNVQEATEVQIQITKEQYYQKLTQEQELSFWNKYMNYKVIPVYGLKIDGETFLTLSGYNEEKMEDSKFGFWVLLVIATLILGGGIYTLYDRKKYKVK